LECYQLSNKTVSPREDRTIHITNFATVGQIDQDFITWTKGKLDFIENIVSSLLDDISYSHMVYFHVDKRYDEKNVDKLYCIDPENIVFHY